MARKTIKGLEEIILDLEKQLNEYKGFVNDRNKQIDHMQSVANDSFENSTEYKRMNNEIEYLRMVIQGHEITIKAKEDSIKGNMNTIQKLLKENEELKNKNNSVVQKIKNERGAGRKARFTIHEKETMKMYRIQGKSIREIADMYNCSVGLVHKIINEQD